MDDAELKYQDSRFPIAMMVRTKNCRKYGRLYTFEAAKEGCRLLGDGWRLPTDAEWKKLAESYGGLRVYENSDWVEKGDSKESYKALSNNGSSGFAALLGGWRDSSGSLQLPRYGRQLLDEYGER